MRLKLHHVKALPQVDELVFDKNWVPAILLQITRQKFLYTKTKRPYSF